MVDFNGSHVEREIVLWGVRWYVAYPISYRQLEEIDPRWTLLASQ
jgi:putative transposase